MTDAVSAMEYPHWLMIAGAVMVGSDLSGLRLAGNSSNLKPDREPEE